MRLAPLSQRIAIVAVLMSPFVGLIAVSAVDQSSAPAKSPDAPKEAPFPLSLFANAKPSDYIDESKCAACHQRGISDNPMFQAFKSFEPSPHRPFSEDPSLPLDRFGCQGCHGPGGPHEANIAADNAYDYIISYRQLTPSQVAMACLRCHTDTMTENHWKQTAHARAGISCTSCHSIHQDGHPMTFAAPGKEPRGPIFAAAAEPEDLLKADQATLCGSCHVREINEFRSNFHHPVPEGRMVCSDCHTVHPNHSADIANGDPSSAIAAESLLVPEGSESCVKCHPEVAGPFVYEHDPAEGISGEGCLDCHQPHGSQNPSMLKSFSRGLCAQCHSDKLTSHNPGFTCWQAGCHVGVHGSDHDPNLLSR